MRIKSRKQREKEYVKLYGDVSLDVYERLADRLGDNLDQTLIDNVMSRLEELKKVEYSSIKIIFYEVPIQSHRPRVANGRRMYVPNAHSNHKAVKDIISDIKEVIDIIAVPMKVVLNAYNPMPTTVNNVELCIYETSHDYGIGKPDFDNILKAYMDMIQKVIIMDDDLVVSSTFNKYYSLKPRVELEIIYPNGFVSEYAARTILNRKSYKELGLNTKLIVTPVPKKTRRRK